MLGCRVGSISAVFSSPVFYPPEKEGSSGGRARAHFPEQWLVIEPRCGVETLKKKRIRVCTALAVLV